MLLQPAGQQQFQRGVGRLELVALELEPFQFIEHILDRRSLLVDVKPEFARLHDDAAPARHVGHEHARAVADGGGIDVFVAPRHLLRGVGVETSLVGEGGDARQRAPLDWAADWPARPGMGKIPQLRKAGPAERRAAHFQEKIGQDRDQVGVPGAFAIAVDRPLHQRRARGDSCERRRHGQPGIVVAVHADVFAAELAHDMRHHGLEIVDHGSAVGVAERQVGGASAFGRGQCPHGVIRVVLVAVEEMLGVVDDFAPVRGQVPRGLLDHGKVLLRRRPQDLDAHEAATSCLRSSRPACPRRGGP